MQLGDRVGPARQLEGQDGHGKGGLLGAGRIDAFAAVSAGVTAASRVTTAATNERLEAAVETGKFREDLYYRLKVVTVDVPPLRERAEDIPLLVNAFIREFNEKNHLDAEGVDDDVIWLFRAYGWPGNVRELRNVVESMAVMSRTNRLTREDIPPNVRRSVEEVKADGVRVGMKLADADRYLIEATLKEMGGNRTRAAKVLGIGLRTLQRKLKSYGVK